MKPRRIVFWCHLATALLAGAVVLIMSATGVLLAYQRQIVAWADRGYRVEGTASAVRLSAATLLDRFRAASPNDTPLTLTVKSDPSAPAAVSLAAPRIIYLDPYSGRVLGEGSTRVRAFFRLVTDWHRWLAAPLEQRAAGRAITGASNLAFLFIVVSGFYLWWPRKWTWSAVGAVVWFRRGLTSKARDFNWHNTIGFWSALPLFVVVLTAVLISYPWANTLLFRLVGEEPPARAEPAAAQAQGRGERRDNRPGGVNLAGLDQGWAAAEQQVEGWKIISVRVPTSPTAPLAFTIDRGNGARPDLRALLTVNAETGAVVRWEPYTSQSLGRRLRTWVRWLHTGEALGVLGQTIAGVASAGACVLVWTGFALTWRRFRAWLARQSSAVVARAVMPPAPARGSLAPGVVYSRVTDRDASSLVPIESSTTDQQHAGVGS